MADDLSKWRLDHWIPVPDDTWLHQKVMVQSVDDENEDIEIFIADQGEMSALMSLDDAENFATLILYEVKRAKGEL